MNKRNGNFIRLLAASVALFSAGAIAAPALADQMEQTYWSMIRNREDAQSFENYLGRFPDGEHAAEARARIEALSGPAAAAGGAAAPVATPTQPAAADATPARLADDMIEKAVAAQSRGDLAMAAEYYAKAAEAGSAAAHVQLGHMLEYGDGVKQDIHKALAHFKAAAGLGDIDGYLAAIGTMDIDASPVSNFDPAGAATLLLDLSRVDRDRAVGTLDHVSAATLVMLQQKLSQGGFYRSTIDGKTGPGTRAALATYAAAGQPAATSTPTDGTLVVTSKGLGTITSQTPYDADALRAALPGYEIAVKRVTVEGMSEVSLIARKDGKDAIKIEGGEGKVAFMQITGPGIADENGMVIGQSTFADYSGRVEERCMVIEEEGNAAEISCESDIPALTYFFSSSTPVREDANGGLRRSSVPADARLVRIMWYPVD